MAKCPHCGGYVKDNKATFESSARRFSKKENTAMAIPDVSTIHNYTTPWPAIIGTGFICGLTLLPIGWGVGVFLLDRAGIRKPEETLAGAILVFVVVGPALVVGCWWLERAARSIIREFWNGYLQGKELDNQALHYKALAGQASVPTAANLVETDKRFVRVVKQILLTAYEHKGPYKAKEVRPWSRDVAKETILIWDQKKVGWSDAVRLGEYLTTNQIIVDGQLNQGRYRTMDAINELLDRDFTRPIVIGASSPALHREVSFIENT